jgi:hypothetical protein
VASDSETVVAAGARCANCQTVLTGPFFFGMVFIVSMAVLTF